MPGKPWLTVVVPMRNESAIIEATLSGLQALRRSGAQLLAVDGGSNDQTATLADPFVDQVLSSSAGRAQQMQLGYSASLAPLIWFLHADSQVDSHHMETLQSLADCSWGFFPIRLSGAARGLRVVEHGINLRTRLTHVATGDQGIFVRRTLLDQIGGIPQLPLMEDVAMSKKLRSLAKPCIAPHPLVTSSRRWEQRGIVRTVLEMWLLRTAYVLGVDPARLAAYYQRRAPRG